MILFSYNSTSGISLIINSILTFLFYSYLSLVVFQEIIILKNPKSFKIRRRRRKFSNCVSIFCFQSRMTWQLSCLWHDLTSWHLERIIPFVRKHKPVVYSTRWLRIAELKLLTQTPLVMPAFLQFLETLAFLCLWGCFQPTKRKTEHFFYSTFPCSVSFASPLLNLRKEMKMSCLCFARFYIITEMSSALFAHVATYSWW